MYTTIVQPKSNPNQCKRLCSMSSGKKIADINQQLNCYLVTIREHVLSLKSIKDSILQGLVAAVEDFLLIIETHLGRLKSSGQYGVVNLIRNSFSIKSILTWILDIVSPRFIGHCEGIPDRTYYINYLRDVYGRIAAVSTFDGDASSLRMLSVGYVLTKVEKAWRNSLPPYTSDLDLKSVLKHWYDMQHLLREGAQKACEGEEFAEHLLRALLPLACASAQSSLAPASPTSTDSASLFLQKLGSFFGLGDREGVGGKEISRERESEASRATQRRHSEKENRDEKYEGEGKAIAERKIVPPLPLPPTLLHSAGGSGNSELVLLTGPLGIPRVVQAEQVETAKLSLALKYEKAFQSLEKRCGRVRWLARRLGGVRGRRERLRELYPTCSNRVEMERAICGFYFPEHAGQVAPVPRFFSLSGRAGLPSAAHVEQENESEEEKGGKEREMGLETLRGQTVERKGKIAGEREEDGERGGKTGAAEGQSNSSGESRRKGEDDCSISPPGDRREPHLSPSLLAESNQGSTGEDEGGLEMKISHSTPSSSSFLSPYLSAWGEGVDTEASEELFDSPLLHPFHHLHLLSPHAISPYLRRYRQSFSAFMDWGDVREGGNYCDAHGFSAPFFFLPILASPLHSSEELRKSLLSLYHPFLDGVLQLTKHEHRQLLRPLCLSPDSLSSLWELVRGLVDFAYARSLQPHLWKGRKTGGLWKEDAPRFFASLCSSGINHAFPLSFKVEVEQRFGTGTSEEEIDRAAALVSFEGLEHLTLSLSTASTNTAHWLLGDSLENLDPFILLNLKVAQLYYVYCNVLSLFKRLAGNDEKMSREKQHRWSLFLFLIGQILCALKTYMHDAMLTLHRRFLQELSEMLEASSLGAGKLLLVPLLQELLMKHRERLRAAVFFCREDCQKIATDLKASRTLIAISQAVLNNLLDQLSSALNLLNKILLEGYQSELWSDHQTAVHAAFNEMRKVAINMNKIKTSRLLARNLQFSN